MQQFKVTKRIIKDINGDDVLTILIEQNLNKNKWKDRFLLFHKETATFKKHVAQM